MHVLIFALILRARFLLLLLLDLALVALQIVQQCARVAAAQINRKGEYQDPDASAADGNAAAAYPASVFDVIAFA